MKGLRSPFDKTDNTLQDTYCGQETDSCGKTVMLPFFFIYYYFYLFFFLLGIADPAFLSGCDIWRQKYSAREGC